MSPPVFRPSVPRGRNGAKTSGAHTLVALAASSRDGDALGKQRWLFAAETDGQSIWMFGGSYQQKQQDPFTTFLEAHRYRSLHLPSSG